MPRRSGIKGAQQAYADIGAALARFDFRRIQGSVYVCDNEDLGNLFDAMNALKALPWFPPAVRDIRAFSRQHVGRNSEAHAPREADYACAPSALRSLLDGNRMAERDFNPHPRTDFQKSSQVVAAQQRRAGARDDANHHLWGVGAEIEQAIEGSPSSTARRLRSWLERSSSSCR